jgi:RNA polymerase sigma-70 factor (ECF subfamily)
VSFVPGDALPLRRIAPPVPAAVARAARTPFDAVVREHEATLVAYATRLCGSSHDARDLVQDTLERALARWDTFTPGTNVRAWLFTILHRGFIDRMRRRAVEKGACSIDDVQVAAPEPAAPPAWTAISLEDLEAAIARLDADFQAVYRLHAVESLSYQQIAERLGIPVSTVGTRLNRARHRLRVLLEASAGAGGEG